jgi:tetratricopeptide (TPR) repeat protein
MRRMKKSWLLAGGLVLASALASPVSAAEPAREFLDKLREKGYFDTALEYLDSVQNIPAMKETLEYEKGTTLIEASRITRDAAIRAKQLDEAQANLNKFLKDKPTHALASSAQKQIGNLLVERARVIVERAKKKNDPAEFKKAYELYLEAGKSFDVTQAAIAEKLKKLPPKVDEKDTKTKELQDQLRMDYLQTQLHGAAIKEESADALPKDSKERTDALTAAAKEYGEIYDKYRTRLAGLYARMYQGRCFHKIGNDKEALSFYTELLEEPDAADEVRTMKTKVLLLAVKSWSSPKEKKYAEAVAKGAAWLDKVRPNESKESDWLELRINVGRAMKFYAEELKAKEPKQANAQLIEARKLVKFVSNLPGEFQKEAKQLLVELGTPETAGGVDKTAEAPKTFAEAFEAGKEQLDNMRVSQQVLATLPARLKVEKDAKVLEDLKSQIAQAEANMPKQQGDAYRLFTASMGLTKADTDIAQVNLVQYYLCYLAYLRNDYYAAALIGDFVAQRYPESPGARQCAKISMAAYVKMFGDLQKEEKAKNPPTSDADILKLAEFESNSVVNICEYITKKWPEHPEAEEALNTLIPFMISTGQLSKAETYLQKIPAESANRGSAELKTGQAMWAEYLKGMQKTREWEKDGLPPGTDLPAKKKELADLKVRAQKTLEDGVNRMKKDGTPNPIFASAMLSLAQIYVDTNQAAKAIAELEDKKVGPLALVTVNDASVSRPGFAEETLKVGLRAYIGALQTADKAKSDELLKKAKLLMDELKKRVGDDADSQDKLVRIYIGIARDLEGQMKLAESPAAKTALSKGFETFLEQVGAETKDFTALNWVAETFYSMGEAFSEGSKGATPAEAKKYYEKANTQFQAILDRGAKQKDFYKPNQEVYLRLRAANCKRKLGDCAGAIKDFEEILKANPMMVNVQVEAARTYQDCALSHGEPKFYFRAIMGSETKQAGKKEGIIWGWGQIARKTNNNEAFKDTFYEARYNLAVCRYGMGKLEKDPVKKKELIEGAERDIKNVSLVSKEYGGENWKTKFDTLARDIQKNLKKQPEGLKAFEVEVKPVSTAAAK